MSGSARFMFDIVRLAFGYLAVVALPALVIGAAARYFPRRMLDDGGNPARAARLHELTVTIAATLAGFLALFAVLSWFFRIPWPWAESPFFNALFESLVRVPLPRPAGSGPVIAVAPFVVAISYCVARYVGELTWPRPKGEVRTAPLVRRTIWATGGARLIGVLATAGLLAISLTVAGAVGDGSGRGLHTAGLVSPYGGLITTTVGPFPGWYFGIPMLIGLGLSLLTTILTLNLITRRPPLTALVPAHDAAIRRTSADRLLAGVQLCLGLALGGVWWIAGHAIYAASSDADGSWIFTLNGDLLARLGAGFAIVSGVVALLALWPRRVRISQAAPGLNNSDSQSPKVEGGFSNHGAQLDLEANGLKPGLLETEARQRHLGIGNGVQGAELGDFA